MVPCCGHFPAPAGDGAARMLAAGPLAWRAEDLMPFMRAVAGPDEEDPLSRDVELGDPTAVSLDGLDVVLSDNASLKPVHRDVYAARERAAGALAAAGARICREHLKGMRRAVELYLATLRDGAGDELSEIFGLDSAPRLRRAAFNVVRRTSDHTIATGVLFAADRLADRIPDSVTRRSISAGRAPPARSPTCSAKA